ncbi:MAG: hypothetical protein ACW99F_03755 [Candidatus Hodarchaeales archaeon]|jgi:hypothetical protein
MIEKIIKRINQGFELEKNRSPDNVGVKGYIKRRLNKDKSPLTLISIVLNNLCNLNCFSCLAKPNTDPYIEKSETVDVFLRNIASWNPGSAVVFSGGEVTLLPDDLLNEIFRVTQENNRKVVLLTNGARLIDFDYVDHVILDNHGINEKAVKEYEKALIKEKIEYTIRKTIYHKDAEKGRLGNISKGARCKDWLKTITLWRGAVFPCCSSCYLDSWDEDCSLIQALLTNGWNYANENLYEVIKDWRNTLPGIMFKKCLLSCWVDSEKSVWRKI